MRAEEQQKREEAEDGSEAAITGSAAAARRLWRRRDELQAGAALLALRNVAHDGLAFASGKRPVG